jgi:hypothetical protein
MPLPVPLCLQPLTARLPRSLCTPDAERAQQIAPSALYSVGALKPSFGAVDAWNQSCSPIDALEQAAFSERSRRVSAATSSILESASSAAAREPCSLTNEQLQQARHSAGRECLRPCPSTK